MGTRVALTRRQIEAMADRVLAMDSEERRILFEILSEAICTLCGDSTNGRCWGCFESRPE